MSVNMVVGDWISIRSFDDGHAGTSECTALTRESTPNFGVVILNNRGKRMLGAQAASQEAESGRSIKTPAPPPSLFLIIPASTTLRECTEDDDRKSLKAIDSQRGRYWSRSMTADFQTLSFSH